MPPKRRGASAKIWLWLVASVAIVLLAGIALVAFRSTSVSVTPRSHTVVFDATAHFTAYPAATASAGTLPYTVETVDLEDTDVVPSSGTQHAEEKASGTITVFNSYSADTVKLIKNTRFATPDGLIFRIPADVVVPGKKGATPGQISVTVFADAVGEKYNVPATAKFTLPGLKSNAAMYSGVYASSAAPMSGGFSGDRPGVAPGALESARAAIRSRLETKAQDTASSRTNASTITLPGLVRITYTSQPSTNESSSSIRLHERAHVEIALFPADRFAETVAASISADAGTGGVALKPGPGFGAKDAEVSGTYADQRIDFTLSGKADLVWKVDAKALAAALAGRDEGAFEGIVNTFPGVQEAHARIEPFWNKSFPSDAAAIKIDIGAPKSDTSA